MIGPHDIIDVHSHAILALGQQAVASPGQNPQWSAEAALEFMDRNGVRACVLSVPDAANHATGNEAREIARQVNETLAQLVAAHPDRFAALATVPGREPEAALDEVRHALDVLELDGVATSTNIGGDYLGQPIFDLWFEELDARGTTLLIHPVIHEASRPLTLGLDQAVLEFMFDTTRALTNLVVTGTKRRFSGINMISTHAGGTIPYLVARIGTLQHAYGLGSGQLELSADEIRAEFASFNYDLTAATTRAQIGALLELVDVRSLLMGLDFPFMPEASFGAAISDVNSYPGFSTSEHAAIAHLNAMRLFPGLARRIGRSADPTGVGQGRVTTANEGDRE